ncbi:MAG: hypothetical protein U0744_21360 [Gemmataceae bacterium]
MTSLAGIQESFGKAADLTLRKLAGLRLSESTVEQLAESAGMRLGRLIKEETFRPQKGMGLEQGPHGKTCAYASLDATGVLMQGPEGSRSKAAHGECGAWSLPQPRSKTRRPCPSPATGVRYLAGLYTLGELGEAMRRRQKWEWIRPSNGSPLSDGGAGLGEFFDVHFPLAVKILDFQHAVGYCRLWPNRRGGRAQRARSCLSAWCRSLKACGAPGGQDA